MCRGCKETIEQSRWEELELFFFQGGCNVVVKGWSASGYIFRWSQAIWVRNQILGVRETRIKFQVSGLSKWEDGGTQWDGRRLAKGRLVGEAGMQDSLCCFRCWLNVSVCISNRAVVYMSLIFKFDSHFRVLKDKWWHLKSKDCLKPWGKWGRLRGIQPRGHTYAGWRM